jgi:plasmid stabilization system protein ParE
MSKQVVWSPLSESDFERILDYLNDNWGDKVANQFIDLTESMLKQIAVNPGQFPVIHNDQKKIRKCVLTKHNTLYYRNSKNQIDLLRIFDSRQNPNKLTFK